MVIVGNALREVISYLFAIKKSKPIIVVLTYLLFLYFAIAYEYKNGYWVPLGAMNAYNLKYKLLTDFINNMVIVILLIYMVRKEKDSIRFLGLTLNSMTLVISLFILYLILFFCHNDISLNGIYTFYFYLVFVSFPEELIFRGYLFNSLNRYLNYGVCVITSGILWSIPHAYLPSIKSGASLAQFAIELMNQIGGGVLISFILTHIYKKSNNLLVPILVHAIMNYNPIKFT